MTDTDKLRALAEKATKGPWYREPVENCGEYGSGPDGRVGFTSYQVCAENGVICDTLNSTIGMVVEEVDGDEHGTWVNAYDQIAERNLDFIAAAHPQAILDLIAENDRLRALVVRKDEALELANEALFVSSHAAAIIVPEALALTPADLKGCVVVPREPTEAMIEAGGEAVQSSRGPFTDAQFVYRAMIGGKQDD